MKTVLIPKLGPVEPFLLVLDGHFVAKIDYVILNLLIRSEIHTVVYDSNIWKKVSVK